MAKFKFEEPDFGAEPTSEGAVEYHPAEVAPASGAEAVLRKHESQLMSLPGVKGVGLGFGRAGEDCIEVFLAYGGAAKNIPGILDGVCVMKTIVGEVDAY